MSRELPAIPNLDHLKKQAKVYLRALQEHHPGSKLSQAQHAIAREYGFASWPKLKSHLAALAGNPPPQPPTLIAPQNPGGDGIFHRFTDKAKRNIFFARQLSNPRTRLIEAEHLLLGLILADGELVNRLIPSQALEAGIRGADRGDPLPQSFPLAHTGTGMATACRKILNEAVNQADRLQHASISTGHFLLAFLSEDVTRETPVLTDIFAARGVELESARNEIVQFLNTELG